MIVLGLMMLSGVALAGIGTFRIVALRHHAGRMTAHTAP
jgi:hypothetical protein